jgi:hypothetical protein
VLIPLFPQQIKNLLSYFGLRILTTDAINGDELGAFRSSTLVPVSLLPLTISRTRLTPSADVYHYYEDPHTAHSAVPLSEALSSLPSNAPLRFRAFLHLFPLPISYPGAEFEYEGTLVRKREKRSDGSEEAGWHLWTDGSSAEPHYD